MPRSTGPVPAALLISGSGPLDRDSNMPGQPLNIGSALAESLRAHGVGSLRFDKRGVGRSEGDYLTTGFDLETARRGVRPPCPSSRQRADGGRLTVIGHSVGATVAIRLARATPWLAGVVLLSASLRSGVDTHALAVGADRLVSAVALPAPGRALRPPAGAGPATPARLDR